MTNHKTEIQAITHLVLLLTALNTLPAIAALPSAPNQGPDTPPRLIVGINIDQLRTDYLEILYQRFGQGGFRKLMQEGAVCEQVTFELDNPDATTAMAVLATGSYPFQNGIGSQFVLDLKTLRRRPAFWDFNYIGNATEGFWSPNALLSSNLADELKLASQQASKIYSIAPNAEEALITAGHAADGAFWIDDKTGIWCSTTFYKEFPSFISNQNHSQPFFSDAPSRGWEAQVLTQGNASALVPYHAGNAYFSHKFQQNRLVMYPWVKTSPIVNDAVGRMAQLFLTKGHLGDTSLRTDMLQLTLYAGTYQHAATEVYPCELEETYLRLDRTIEDLLQVIDRQVGLRNTIVYLTSTGNTNRNTDNVPGISHGEFNANRCSALLNIQLNSLYGQGQWIEGFENMQFYLNHKLIEQKQLQVEDVAREAARFVSLFSGVDEVFTTQQLLHEDYSQRIERIRNGYCKASGGDLVILLQPGWSLRLDDRSDPQPQIRHDIYPGPAIIFAPSRVTPQRITQPVDATAIAPTVARAIRIRAPSCCRTLPLRLE